MEQVVSLEEELKRSYLEYSLSVIIGRALPDVRDGLKPVHRRILYAMHELGNYYNRPYKKSARIVGDVIGKYHPHGDAAVYDALVRMVQDFNMRYPLIDGQGNFGSIDGDAPAAMRYTECRMSRFASEFLKDIDKNTVDFHPNYDNTLQEPEVLPTTVPNLLVNGSSGIAVGMATNIPPHNLDEVVDCFLAYIDNPDITLDEMLKYIKGPDFPTGGYIYGLKGLKDAYATGKGVIRIRGKVKVEKRARDLESIIITEIPYGLNKSSLVKKIAELIQSQKLKGISDLRDESDRNGIRIVLDLKRGTPAKVIINKLYKYTPLDTSFGINMVAVVGNRPKLITLKEYLELFFSFRKEVVIRRTRFELEKAEKRAHILEGLRIALDNIDEVVYVIKSSKTPQIARDKLMERFNLSEVQAQAILDMRLQRLTNLEKNKIIEEYKDILKKIEYLKSILQREEVLKNVIKEELLELKNNYSSPRKTELLLEDPQEIDIKDLVADEKVIVTITKKGFIKRTALSSYAYQRRGGKGMVAAELSSEDVIQDVIATSNHQNLFLFSNKGRVFLIKVYQIPEAQRRARGIHISNLLELGEGEFITTTMDQRDFEEDKFFLFITKFGKVKLSSASEYKNIRSNGLIALGLRDEDELIVVKEVRREDEVMILTKKGFSIRFSCKELNPLGRTAQGVKGITLREDDEVVSSVILRKDEDNNFLLTITENGYGKRVKLDQYKAQARGGKGIINLKPTPKTGDVVGAIRVNEDDQIIITTLKNKAIRLKVKEIPVYSRNAKGVRLLNLDDEDKVISFDRI